MRWWMIVFAALPMIGVVVGAGIWWWLSPSADRPAWVAEATLAATVAGFAGAIPAILLAARQVAEVTDRAKLVVDWGTESIAVSLGEPGRSALGAVGTPLFLRNRGRALNVDRLAVTTAVWARRLDGGGSSDPEAFEIVHALPGRAGSPFAAMRSPSGGAEHTSWDLAWERGNQGVLEINSPFAIERGATVELPMLHIGVTGWGEGAVRMAERGDLFWEVQLMVHTSRGSVPLRTSKTIELLDPTRGDA